MLAVSLATGIGHFAINFAHRSVPLATTGAAQLAVPVSASIMAAVFLGQEVLPMQVLGILIVIASFGLKAYVDFGRSSSLPVAS